MVETLHQLLAGCSMLMLAGGMERMMFTRMMHSIMSKEIRE